MASSQLPFGDYATVHANPWGPGDDRPIATQILRNEGLLDIPNRLSGKTVFITGGTSGLGLEVAKALHSTGAKIFITGRCEPANGRDIASTIRNAAGISNKNNIHPVRFVSMDLADLTSVRDGAADFLKQSHNKLNLLICNAGVMAFDKWMMTAQGHEMQFGVNHLAHFLLFKTLCPALLATSAEDFASRVVTVSSCAHRGSGLLAKYDTSKALGMAYGQSKTANIYMANELERRFSARGLHGLSVHPGVILETGLVRHLADDYKQLETQFNDTMPGFEYEAKNAQQGAASIIWAAVAAKLEGVGGLYLEDCDVAQPATEGMDENFEWFKRGRSGWCYDRAAEEKLWLDSEHMVESWLL